MVVSRELPRPRRADARGLFPLLRGGRLGAAARRPAARLRPRRLVFHHGGTAIGTGRPDERPSAFSNYFNYRNRMRFMRRFHPARLPLAYLIAWR